MPMMHSADLEKQIPGFLGKLRCANEVNRTAFKKVKEHDVCAEIGVWEGDYSALILDKNPSELHLIDPWIHQDYPVEDKKDLRIYCCKQEEMERVYNRVVERLSHDPRVKIHRKFSIETKFPKKYFDWVYIDGNHSYENVLEDLWHYLPLMKSGGLLCGDDYAELQSDPHANGGPERAVKEFIEATGYKVEIENDCQFLIRIE
jgi:hypothetical protein